MACLDSGHGYHLYQDRLKLIFLMGKCVLGKRNSSAIERTTGCHEGWIMVDIIEVFSCLHIHRSVNVRDILFQCSHTSAEHSLQYQLRYISLSDRKQTALDHVMHQLHFCPVSP